MSQTAKVDQVFKAQWPAPTDKYGNETTVEEHSVSFKSDDEDIATVEPDPDAAPYGAIIKTGKKVGSTMIKISADADKDSGEERLLEGFLTVEVLPGEAVAFGEATVTEPTDNADTPE